MGNTTQATQAASDSVRLASSPSVLTVAAAAYARLGQKADATKLVSRALEGAKDRYVCRFLVADAYVELGDTERALESLEQGLAQRST
jgi:predicted Zn-dependent protease